MNRFHPQLILAFCTAVLIGGLASCTKYSDDEPLPVEATPTLYTASNNAIVYALDAKTGEAKWKRALYDEIIATPVLFKEKLWVGTKSGILYRLNSKDGTPYDTLALGGTMQGTPLEYGDRLIIAAGTKLIAYGSELDTAWIYDTGGEIVASPAKHYIAKLEKDGIFIANKANKVIAIDQDGGLLWEQTPSMAAGFSSSPCVVNDSFLYVGNDNGALYALFTHDGSLKWKYQTGGEIKGSPIQIGGNVLVGSGDRYFYSVDSATGGLRWKVETQDIISSSPAVFNQNVYFGGYDSYIYCVDIIDGTIKWRQRTFGLIKSSPTIYDGSVFIGGFDKNLYRLDAKDGQQQWVRNINGQMQCSAIIDTLGGLALPSISGNYPY